MVLWPADKANLSFGKLSDAVITGFAMIDQNNIPASVKALAHHEQINVLQPVIYDSPAMKFALNANQFSWTTNFPTGAAAEIELTLSAECKSKSSSLNIWFSKKKTAKLYDKDQRMVFVYEAAARFDSLLHSNDSGLIEASLNTIASNGGAR